MPCTSDGHRSYAFFLTANGRAIPASTRIRTERGPGIIEEAVSAVVFSRAKKMRFYEGIDHVDYDMLKTITEFVRGFEVDQAPLWQWEAAILNGYRVFRALRDNSGGWVSVDLVNRVLGYAPSRRGGTT